MIENRQARRRFARERSRDERVIRWSVSHALFALLALLALSIQTLIIQPHFHPSRVIGWSNTVSQTSVLIGAADRADTANNHSSLARPDRYPINEDPSNCPLCQEISHSGQFVHSAAMLVVAPLFVTAKFVIFQKWRSLALAVSHIWQGRAPPQS